MKPVTLKADSWHWYLAHEWAHHWDYETDICTYTRRVLWGLTKLVGLCAVGMVVGGFFLFCIADMVGWIAAMLRHLVWIDPEALGGAIAIVLLLAVLVTTFMGISAVLERHGWRVVDAVTPAPESFVRHAWRAFKDKTCLRVELK